MYGSTRVWAHTHTQKDLVSNSTHVWVEEKERHNLAPGDQALLFPLMGALFYCDIFTVLNWHHQLWSDRCVLCCHYSWPQAPGLSCHWLSHLVKTQGCEVEGMSWRPDQKELFSQICALVSLPVICIVKKVDVASWILYSRFITTVGFKLVIWILEVQSDAFQMHAKVG